MTTLRRGAGAVSVAAPIRGLNLRDSPLSVSPEHATRLVNWWPLPGHLETRPGSLAHATGFAAPVETVAEYVAPSGAARLFAAAGTGIWDVTSPGAIGAPVVTGTTSPRWESANITTPGGSFLYLVNGADTPRLFNGAAWIEVTAASTPAITGVATNALAHVVLFKHRLYFTERNALRVWYLPTLSVGGAALALDLGAVFRLGGSIVCCATWTLDAGDGADDHLVVLTTQGEVAVFDGTDPGNAATWGLVGVYQMPRPVGRRCTARMGGELAVLATDGVYPLSSGLQRAAVRQDALLTDVIRPRFLAETQAKGALNGWQLTLHPDGNALLVNVPGGAQPAAQLVLNTQTGAWTEFRGWDARCFAASRGQLFFGDATRVVRAWTGTVDGAAQITAECSTAAQFFGSTTVRKRVTMLRPQLFAVGAATVSLGLTADFADLAAYRMTFGVAGAATVMAWGAMTWDSMTWGGSLTPLGHWVTMSGVGRAITLHLRCVSAGMVQFAATDFVLESGGVL